MPLFEHDNVVQALPSDRADHPLDVPVHPRRLERNDLLLDAVRLDRPDNPFPVDAVAVADQKPRRRVEREGQDQLQPNVGTVKKSMATISVR
jgi:hypothetical protein